MWKTIYLTGAPASGKSSTTRLLAERVPKLAVWEYGSKLTEYVQSRTAAVSSQEYVRAQSAAVITPADVAAVDEQLVSFVSKRRGQEHVVIDSHAVTKERYGFRITPFSLRRFADLAPDEIWVLSASPETTTRRIAENSGGRPMVTEEEARAHTTLQSSVAATYAMSLGIPCYIFNTDGDRETLLSTLVERLS